MAGVSRRLLSWCLSAALAGGVGAAASSPVLVNPETAQAQTGGCGAGRCFSGSAFACGEMGDGCDSYQQCMGTTGDLFCTPQKFCTAAGCSPINGQTCK